MRGDSLIQHYEHESGAIHGLTLVIELLRSKRKLFVRLVIIMASPQNEDVKACGLPAAYLSKHSDTVLRRLPT